MLSIASHHPRATDTTFDAFPHSCVQAWIQDAALKLKPLARAIEDAADDSVLLLAERGRSDGPASDAVKLAPSRGRPVALPGAHRGGQAILMPLDPEVKWPSYHNAAMVVLWRRPLTCTFEHAALRFPGADSLMLPGARHAQGAHTMLEPH